MRERTLALLGCLLHGGCSVGSDGEGPPLTVKGPLDTDDEDDEDNEDDEATSDGESSGEETHAASTSGGEAETGGDESADSGELSEGDEASSTGHADAGESEESGEGTEVSDGGWAGSCSDDIDLVFSVDLSSKMHEFFLGQLLEELRTFDTLPFAAEFATARYGLVVFVDGAMMPNLAEAYGDLDALADDLEEAAARTYGGTLQLDGSTPNETPDTENSMDALYLATTAFDWRPSGEARRAIIHATANAFWDGTYPPDAATSTQRYEDVLTALEARGIHTFTITSEVEGAAQGWSVPYEGHPPIPEATRADNVSLEDMSAGFQTATAVIVVAAKDTEQCP